MSEDQPVKKRVDESWKEQVEREKQVGPPARPHAPLGAPAKSQAAPAQPAPLSVRQEPPGEPLDETALPEPEMPEVTGPDGMPIGVQVVARRGNDALTLAAAAALEQVFGAPAPVDPR